MNELLEEEIKIITEQHRLNFQNEIERKYINTIVYVNRDAMDDAYLFGKSWKDIMKDIINPL